MIIGLIGPKGVGKSTLANQLMNDTKILWFRRPFAYILKQMLGKLLESQGVSQNAIQAMLDGDAKEINSSFLGGKTPRWAMQSLGTEWGRRLIGPDLWVDAWKAHVLSHRFTNVIAEDCRFRNEAQAIHDLGGRIIALHRDGFGPGEHQSEREYLEIKPDVDVYNMPNEPTHMYETIQAFIQETKSCP